MDASGRITAADGWSISWQVSEGQFIGHITVYGPKDRHHGWSGGITPQKVQRRIDEFTREHPMDVQLTLDI